MSLTLCMSGVAEIYIFKTQPNVKGTHKWPYLFMH